MPSKFKGRSAHTILIPSKTISEGYKILAVYDVGYTLNRLFTSRSESIAEHHKDDNLTPTGSAYAQLCEALNSTIYWCHIVFMYNAFTTVPLLRNLRQWGIGGCGTARANASGWQQNLSAEWEREEWGDVQATTVSPAAVELKATNCTSGTDHTDVLYIR